MEKILAILTKEKKYAERLCDYVNRKNNYIFTAVPFDDKGECSAFSRNHKIEILLADSELLGAGGYMQNLPGKQEIIAERTIRLVEEYHFERAMAERGAVGYGDTISKFQPADMIIRDVLHSCEDMELMKTSETVGRPVRIIGVYSPISRCGKSAFALTLSRILNRSSKCLYLSLEEFSGMELLTGESYTSSLSDAIYHMKQGTLTAQKIYSMIYNYSGVDYIPPIRFADDRNAVSGEDYVHLISSIFKNTRYENIVVDMYRYADEASDIIEICNTVYMPVTDNYMDKMKIESFVNYLVSSERLRNAERLIRVKVPEIEIHGNGTSYLDSLMYGSMGDLIRSLKEG